MRQGISFKRRPPIEGPLFHPTSVARRIPKEEPEDLSEGEVNLDWLKDLGDPMGYLYVSWTT